MEPLNIPFIKDRIRTTHKSFIDSVGDIPFKLTADHQFILTRMATRIETILKCFQDEKIVELVGQGRNASRSCVEFELIKRGFDRSVYVWTDGVNISINTKGLPYRSGLNVEDDVLIKDVDFDTYNWLEFSDQLLHYIHKIIYARKKAFETKIFNSTVE